MQVSDDANRQRLSREADDWRRRRNARVSAAKLTTDSTPDVAQASGASQDVGDGLVGCVCEYVCSLAVCLCFRSGEAVAE